MSDTTLNDIVTSLDDEPMIEEQPQATEVNDEQELPETSAGSEPETEEKTEGEPKNGLQERFNKLTAEKYAEKRRAEELERKLKELESKLQQPTATPDDLTPPSLPEDTWDAEAMRKYHEEMLAYNRKLAQHEARNALTSKQTEAQQLAQQAEQQKTLQTFAKRAIDNGVDLQGLQQAGSALAEAGLDAELQMLILEDEAGPQLTMYLAQHPDEAYALINAPKTKAAIKLATEIKAKALSKTPKVTKTPDPIPEGKPAALREQDEFERQFKGAKFL